jgi:hypothetical protein
MRLSSYSDIVPFEPQQQAVVDVTGIVDPVQVDHQGASECAQVNEVVPVAPVAGEARGLQTVDGAHFAGADQGDELLEARAHGQSGS